MKRKIAIVLSLVMILGMTCQVNAAAEVGNLYNCQIGISSTGNGVGISITTMATTSASEIGCEGVVLQEKVDGKWIDIPIESGNTTNSTHYGASATYTYAVKGRAYRAHCTHYAKWGSTKKTLYNETNEMIYN